MGSSILEPNLQQKGPYVVPSPSLGDLPFWTPVSWVPVPTLIADSKYVLILAACSLAKYSPKPVIYADGLGKVTPGLSTRGRSFEQTVCGQNHSFEPDSVWLWP